MRDVFVARLTELAERDPRVFLITADLGFGVLTEFARRFPRQYLNVGVAEQNMTGVATGLALEGRVVFTYSIANFPTLRCLEQLRNDVCYHRADVKVIAVGGGLSYGALGISHHATEDLSILRSLPEMTVVAPGDDWEVAEATTALVSTPGPFYMRLDRSSVPEPARPGETFHFGKARTLREGSAMTLIATGGMLATTLQVADNLAKDDIRCRVLSMHTVKPLDRAAVYAACVETGGLVTVEEHSLDGGLGAAVAEACFDAGIFPRASLRVGLSCGFSAVAGSQEYLRGLQGLDERSIRKGVTRLVERRHASAHVPPFRVPI